MDEKKFNELGVKIAKCLSTKKSTSTIGDKYQERLERMDDISKFVYMNDPLTQISCPNLYQSPNRSWIYDPNHVLKHFELAYSRKDDYQAQPEQDYKGEQLMRIPPPPPPPSPVIMPSRSRSARPPSLIPQEIEVPEKERSRKRKASDISAASAWADAEEPKKEVK